MGLIRGTLLTFVCVALFVSLLFGNIFWTISMSLNYDTVEKDLTTVILDVFQNEMGMASSLNATYPMMQTFCENHTSISGENLGLGENFDLPCSAVSLGVDGITNYFVHELVLQGYNKDYECGFWDCFTKSKSPLFLVSAKARDYWASKFHFTLILSLILSALVFLLVEKKYRAFLVVGFFVVLAALPLTKVSLLVSFFLAIIGLFAKIGVLGDYVSDLFLMFFTKSHTVFSLNLILGVVLILLGIGLGLWRFSRGAGKTYSKKDVQKIVKAELGKQKSSNKKDEPKADFEKKQSLKVEDKTPVKTDETESTGDSSKKILELEKKISKGKKKISKIEKKSKKLGGKNSKVSKY